ncbi:conserved hypothetical protein [Tenacibaculum sediminilitoris]|uniref:hypothetical protein n=1 Tax=Tenacibaculum sediminilitoris TaxID=1820334 RepID=UPI003892FC19
MSKLKKKIKKYVTEFLVVAFGVFLGIYVNEWENNKQLNSDKEKVIQNILSELEDNKEKLLKSVSYHQKIKINLDSTLAKTPEEIKFERYLGNKHFKFVTIKGWTGVNFPEYDTTAFEVAKMSGILQNMDINVVQEISKIYNKIQNLASFQNLITNKMMELNYETKVIDVVGSLTLVVGDNLNMEKLLVKEVEKTIAHIKG